MGKAGEIGVEGKRLGMRRMHSMGKEGEADAPLLRIDPIQAAGKIIPQNPAVSQCCRGTKRWRGKGTLGQERR